MRATNWSMTGFFPSGKKLDTGTKDTSVLLENLSPDHDVDPRISAFMS